MLDEIPYPFPNFNGCTVECLGMDKWFHPTHHNGCNQSSILGLKLNHVCKGGPWAYWPSEISSCWSLCFEMKGFSYLIQLTYYQCGGDKNANTKHVNKLWNMQYVCISNLDHSVKSIDKILAQKILSAKSLAQRSLVGRSPITCYLTCEFSECPAFIWFFPLS